MRRRPHRFVRWLALRVFVAFAALLVAAPGFAAGKERYRCRHSGLVMEHCCCKRLRAAEAPAKAPKIAPVECCDVLRSASSTAAPVVKDLPVLPNATACGSSLIAVPEPEATPSAPACRHSIVEARAGPPIFLRDCRLLT